MAQRPKFEPSYCNPNGLLLNILDDYWVPIICCTASFPLECVRQLLLLLLLQTTEPEFKFEEAISQLIHHPEYNSTLILRSEVLSEGTSTFLEQIPSFRDRQRTSYIHRKMLPCRPGWDSPLEQFCTLYATSDGPDTLILTPVLKEGTILPYYHPSVSQLAFRYLNHEQMLRIEVVLHPDTPKDINSRLFRTCLSLLETLHRYGWGVVTNYKKRVIHDCLIPRDTYQDLYLVMRERHKHLIDTWQEVTDPLKHVFEVIPFPRFALSLSECKLGHRNCHISHASLERYLFTNRKPRVQWCFSWTMEDLASSACRIPWSRVCFIIYPILTWRTTTDAEMGCWLISWPQKATMVLELMLGLVHHGDTIPDPLKLLSKFTLSTLLSTTENPKCTSRWESLSLGITQTRWPLGCPLCPHYMMLQVTSLFHVARGLSMQNMTDPIHHYTRFSTSTSPTRSIWAVTGPTGVRIPCIASGWHP